MKYEEQKIILDSCIYRRMPLSLDGIDYRNLLDYLKISNGSLLICEVVKEELCDYFTNDYIVPKIEKYTKITDELSKNKYLDKFIFPDLTEEKNNAAVKFNKLLNSPIKQSIQTIDLPSKEIVQFIIENKRTKPSKDNLRDFLILRSLVKVCSQEPTNEFIFITQDEIYSKNSKFSSLIPQNLSLFSSIPDFLQVYGFRINFLTPELLLSTISKDKIENDLSDFKKDFYSFITGYISGHHRDLYDYYIYGLKVKNIYTYKDINSKKQMFVAHITVQLYISFVSDRYSYKNYIWEKEFGQQIPFGEFDDEKAEFDDDVVVIYRGTLDIDNEKILDYQFEDYIY